MEKAHFSNALTDILSVHACNKIVFLILLLIQKKNVETNLRSRINRKYSITIYYIISADCRGTPT